MSGGVKGKLTAAVLLAGLLGAFGCTGAMVLAVVGTAGVAVSAGTGEMDSMAAMGSHATSMSGAQPGVLGFFVHNGPIILLVSVAAVVASLAARRKAVAVPALLAGAVLYWGMYGQGRLVVMYGAIIISALVWATAYIWTARQSHRSLQAQP